MTGQWLVGNNMTVADVMVAALMQLPFMVLLDEGLRKPAPKVYEWYERVIADASFKAIFGKRSIVPKACKPTFKEAGAGGE